jgi:oxygen-independent coproporphyrinogen-3 oxidase
VLHAHPSPAQWQTNFSEKEVTKNLLTTDGEKTLINMYVGIPYCLPTDPPHCGFCLFPTEKYNGKKDTSDYLEYVAKESELYKEFYKDSIIESLYIGGGTPNLLAPPDYFRLMKIVSDLFPQMDNNIEKTIEGIPQLFNEEKIKAISESGFNRVSMGVQQVSTKLIKSSGRKQTRKQVFDQLRENGVGVNVHYIPVHTQPFYKNMGFNHGDFPVAESYYSEAISLPMFHLMTHEQQDKVVSVLKDILG